MKKKSFVLILVLCLLVVLVATLVACSPASEGDKYPYENIDDDNNQNNVDKTTKDEAVSLTADSITNLKEYIKSTTVSEVGYYMEFDFKVNTENGSNFYLKFRANIYAYPYKQFEEGSDEYVKALKKHNEVCKKSDILIEWYDGQQNEMLIGFYFDGVNQSSTNPGNKLYLNVQGEKRYYNNFGDTVLFQQLIRLITQLDIDTILASNDSSIDDTISLFEYYLGQVITTNYKLTKNGDQSSVYYDAVNLNVITGKINSAISAVFSPFEDKIDPLTNEYLRFKFSSIAGAEIRSLASDMRFIISPDSAGTKNLLSGFEGEFTGTANSKGETIPFTSEINLKYSARVSSDIDFSTDGYILFEHGEYELEGDLYIPLLKTTLDLRILTSLNEVDNTTNRIDARFYDLATNDPMVMIFYQNELLYINTDGFSDRYGGAVSIEDVGFPTVYIPDIDMAELMKWFYDTVNNGIVSIVDSLLDPATYSGEGVDEGIVQSVMKKMVSTDDTMTITIDHELLKDILRYTQEVDPEAEIPLDKNGNPIYSLDEEGRPVYTTSGLVYILEDFIGYDLDEIASMLGIQSSEKLLEYTWFEISYNVKTGVIKIELYSSVRKTRSLIMRMNLWCVAFGKKTVFPNDEEGLEGYTELKSVKTLSGKIQGTVKFSASESVDLSSLIGTMIGDRHGLNTPYTTQKTSTIDFNLIMDQYIQYSEDDENLNAIISSIANEGVQVDYADIVNETRGRIAFYFTLTVKSESGEDRIVKLYAYNVSFNNETYKKIERGETLEGYGYVYADITGGKTPALNNIPLLKIREDIFLDSLSTYLGTNEAIENASTLSIASIVSALMEDAVVEVIPGKNVGYLSVTTSNNTIKKLFGVDDVVANFRINIGLKAQVKGQYNQFSTISEYYSYTVGTLDNLTVLSIYDSTNPIHNSILVTFKREKDGVEKALNMKFVYYRRSKPVKENYVSDEEYERAVEDYELYISSDNNIDLVDGKSVYYPKVDGPFMGEEREYILTISNPGSQLMATSLITSLASTEFEWEPLEEKPTTIICNHTNGTASYSADYQIDFDSVTIEGLDGAYYEVIIGKGSLGEFSATVKITVLNRLIVNKDGSQAGTVMVKTSTGYVDAAIAETRNIDPYAYIISRYNNSTYRNIDNEYITIYLRNVSFTLNFASGKTYTGTFDWLFDQGEDGFYVEKAISAEGGVLYVHTTFKNQVIALKLVVQEKTVDHIMFDGETTQNEYTVDVLDTNTWTIPTTPTVYFQDGSSRRFPFSFVWSATRASNVTIDGAKKNAEGTLCPFPDYTGNVISAALDISSVLGIGEWFGIESLTATVNVPEKSLYDYGSAVAFIDSASSSTGTVAVKSIDLYEGEKENYQGYWFLDPYYEASMTLPRYVTAKFQDGTSKRYLVNWDTTSGIIVEQDGEYKIFSGAYSSLSSTKIYELKSSIGDGEAKYPFSIALVVLPTFTNVKFLVDGSALTDITGSGLNYTYTVDAFDQTFKVPSTISLSSASDINIGSDSSGNPKIYTPTYEITPTETLGDQTKYDYIIGEGALQTVVTLGIESTAFTVKSLGLVVNDQEVYSQDASGNQTKLGIIISTTDKTINITGLNLYEDGTYRYVYNGQNYEKSAIEFIKWLLTSGTVLTYNETLTSSYAVLVDFEKGFSSQNIAGSGQNITLRLSKVPGVLDYKVNIKGSLKSKITDVDKEFTLTQYAADGTEIYKSQYGYDLAEYKLTVREDGKSVVFENLEWYVDSTSDKIFGDYKSSDRVTHISRETIYGKHAEEQWVLLYSHLPDGTRVTLKVYIPALDWTKFNSMEDYDGQFVIENGKITINNMFTLESIDKNKVINALPKSIRFRNLVASDVKWMILDEAANQLKSLDYKTNSTFVLAKATVDVVGELDIELLITFSACIPQKIETTEVQGVEKTFNSATLTEDISITPYKTNIGGIYTLAKQSKITFESGESFEFADMKYYSGTDLIDTISFDYTAKTVEFTSSLPYGLTLNYNLKVVDSTISTSANTITIGENTEKASNIRFGKVYTQNIIKIDGVEYTFDTVDGQNIVFGSKIGTIDYDTSIVSIDGTSYAFSDVEFSNRKLVVNSKEYYFLYDGVYGILGKFDKNTYSIEGILDGSIDKAEIIEKGYYDLSSPEAFTDIYTIDPYKERAVVDGEKTYLPTKVAVEIDGKLQTLDVVWDENISVNYLGSELKKITGKITTAGITSQEITVIVSVKAKTDITDIKLFDEQRLKVYSSAEGQNYTLYVDDTLSYNASNLPKFAVLDGSLVEIEWNASAANFNVSGGTSVITGYIVSSMVGHTLSLSVVMDEYSFKAIWRPTSTTKDGKETDDYTEWTYGSMMSPIGFTFVNLTGARGAYYVSYRAYMVQFNVKNNNPDLPDKNIGDTRTETRYFVPSNIAKDGDNVITFDNSVVLQSEQTATDQVGSFYLGGAGKTSLQVTGATYMVKEKVLYEESLTYSYITRSGEQDSQYLLIDPLNPTIPEYAYAYTNWSEAEKVKFKITDSSSFDSVNLNSYLYGGVLKGKRFGFTLVDDNDAPVLDSTGAEITIYGVVEMLFLDRRAVSATEIKTELLDEFDLTTYEVLFTSSFSDTTYLDSNPYSSVESEYGNIINALNIAVDVYGDSLVVVNKTKDGVFKKFSVEGKDYEYVVDILVNVK